MAEITVDRASIEHLDKLYKIEIECFEEEAFTRRQIADLVTAHNSANLVARVDGEIVGFVIGRISVDTKPRVGHILTIDVSPKHRRKGIGLRLLQSVEGILKNEGVRICWLEARHDNLSALNLYRKSGYKEVERLENYYGEAHGVHLKKILA